MNTLGYQARRISRKKQGISYIESSVIIGLAFVKCHLVNIIANVQLYYIMMGDIKLAW